MRFYSKAKPSNVTCLHEALNEELERCVIPLRDLELYFPDRTIEAVTVRSSDDPYSENKDRKFYRGTSMIPELVLGPNEVLVEATNLSNIRFCGEPGWQPVKSFPTRASVFVYDTAARTIKLQKRSLEGLSPAPTMTFFLANVLFAYMKWFSKSQGSLHFTSSHYGFREVRDLIPSFDESSWSHVEELDDFRKADVLAELWNLYGPFSRGFMPVSDWLTESSANTPRILRCKVEGDNFIISLGVDSRIAAFYAIHSKFAHGGIGSIIEKHC